MKSQATTFKSFIAGAFALAVCPCHLPITLPLLLTFTAGTTLGSWLAGHTVIWFGVSTVLFVVSLFLALHWGLTEEDETSTCTSCAAAETKHPYRRQILTNWLLRGKEM
nr:hypothetical protein [Ardenticatena sp.]